jgi:hypothetical protein
VLSGGDEFFEGVVDAAASPHKLGCGMRFRCCQLSEPVATGEPIKSEVFFQT